MKWVERWAEGLLYGWVAILSTLYSLLALIRHHNFQSGGFDLGIFDQAIWQYAHFLYPFNTIKDRFILGDHLTLTLPLMAPLFWIWEDVRILLITQAIWIAISAIAIYKIAILRKLSPAVALCVSFVYSIFYGIQFGAFFDWHSIIIGVGLIAWLAYFFEAKKKKLFWITLVLAILTQENMGIALACLGLIYVFHKQYRKRALFFILGGVSISALAIGIVTILSPIGYEYKPSITQNIVTIFGQYVNAHDKQLVWLYSFASFAFLPLFSIGTLFAVVLDLTQYIGDSGKFTPYTHHRAMLGVLLALGMLDGLLFLKKLGFNLLYISILLVTVAISLQYALHLPLNKLIKQDYWHSKPWMEDNRALLKTIPGDMSIAATQNIVPHLSHRKEIYLIWPRKKTGKDAQALCKTDTCWWLDFSGKPHYMIVNTDKSQWATQLLESPENFLNALENGEKAGRFKLERSSNSARLYTVQ